MVFFLFSVEVYIRGKATVFCVTDHPNFFVYNFRSSFLFVDFEIVSAFRENERYSVSTTRQELVVLVVQWNTSKLFVKSSKILHFTREDFKDFLNGFMSHTQAQY